MKPVHWMVFCVAGFLAGTCILAWNRQSLSANAMTLAPAASTSEPQIPKHTLPNAAPGTPLNDQGGKAAMDRYDAVQSLLGSGVKPAVAQAFLGGTPPGVTSQGYGGDPNVAAQFIEAQLAQSISDYHNAVSNNAATMGINGGAALADAERRIGVLTSLLKQMQEQSIAQGNLDVSRQNAATNLLAKQNILRGHAAAKGGGNPLSTIESCFILAEDKQYLGRITRNEYDSESILNVFGRFGSTFSNTSIFNDFGRYGGELGLYSPFNSVSATPPKIFTRDGNFVAYLTVNKLKSPRIDPHVLIVLLKNR